MSEKAQEILSQFTLAKDHYSKKDFECMKLREYYLGNFFGDFAPGSTIRDEVRTKTKDGSVPVIYNPCYITIRDNTALESQAHIINVPPKTVRGTDLAIQNRNILCATHGRSGGDRLIRDTVFDKRLYGWTVLMAVPDFKEKFVRVVNYSAANSYPLFKFGAGRRELRGLFVTFKASAEAVKDEYGAAFKGGGFESEDVEMVLWFGPDENMVFADSQPVKGYAHKWGKVPGVVIPCILAPGTIGIGDIHQVIGLAMTMNRNIALTNKLIEKVVEHDVLHTGDSDLELSKDGDRLIWNIPEGERIDPMPPPSGHYQEMFGLISRLEGWVGDVTNTSAARKGKREGMYVSQKGQEALMKPQGDQLDDSLRTQAECIALLNEHILWMYEEVFTDVKMHVQGRLGGASYDVEFTGKQIKGHHRNDVTYLPPILRDSGTKDITLQQMMGSGLISKEMARRHSSINYDLELEQERIDQEFLHDAKLQAISAYLMAQANVQAQAPPEMPGALSTDPNAIPAENKALEKGLMPQNMGALPAAPMAAQATPAPEAGMEAMMGAPPPMPEGAAPAEAMMGAPEVPGVPGVIPEDIGEGLIQLPDIVDAIREAKVRGQVYITGKAVFIGSLDATAGDALEVAITNPLDKRTIENAVPDAPVQFTKVDGPPDEPYVDASPGTSGYEVENQDAAQDIINPAAPEATLGAMPPPGEGAV